MIDRAPASTNNGPTILIAEDDVEIRTALERILGYEGYSTVVAGDGSAALAAVAEGGLLSLIHI